MWHDHDDVSGDRHFDTWRVSGDRHFDTLRGGWRRGAVRRVLTAGLGVAVVAGASVLAPGAAGSAWAEATAAGSALTGSASGAGEGDGVTAAPGTPVTGEPAATAAVPTTDAPASPAVPEADEPAAPATEAATATEVPAPSTPGGATPQDVPTAGSAAELAAAHRNDLPDGTYAITTSLGSRRVLDVDNASSADGANVQIWESNGSRGQRWRVTHDADGYVTLISAASGKVLDVTGGTGSQGTNVQQWSGNGTLAQKWVVVRGEGGYAIVSALDPSLALDVSGASSDNGTNVQLWGSNGTAAQTYGFVAATPAVAPTPDAGLDGSAWYSLVPQCAPGSAVDVSGGSVDDAANVQIWGSNETPAQQFAFESVGGYWRIVNVASGKVLDVAGGDVVAGANVAQWAPASGNDNQLFAVEKNGDGSYTFVNKASGLALDVAGAGSADGTNLDAYTPNGTAAQRFELVRHDEAAVEAGTYVLASSKDTGVVVDVAGGSLDAGAKVQLWEVDGTMAQTWYVAPASASTLSAAGVSTSAAKGARTIENVGSGMRLAVGADGSVRQVAPADDAAQLWTPTASAHGVSFESVARPGQVLGSAGGATANGTGLTVSAGGSAAQAFRLRPVDAVLASGSYVVHMASSHGSVLDVAGGAVGRGANVQVWQANGSGAQAWEFARQSDGTYTVKNEGSGRLLDVQGASTASGTNVQQWDANGNRAQRWRVTYVGGGWRISSALDDALALDVAGGSSADGANVQVTRGGSDGQHFVMTRSDYVDPILRDAEFKRAAFYSRGRYGLDWQAIVIHISECPTMDVLDGTFTGGGREASAHFGVGGTTVHQYVALGDTAWAVGNWEWNKRTVSIEHVGTTANPPSYETLDTSARLMAALAKLKGWNSLTLGVNVGIHKWYGSTTCPATLDYRWLVKRANEYLESGTDGSFVDGAAYPQFATASVTGASPESAPEPFNARALRMLVDPDNLTLLSPKGTGGA